MNLEEQCHAEEMLRKIERVEAERDNAWTELREIRAAISANQEESTLDEVVKLRQQLADRDEQISDLTISSDTYFAERNSARDVWRRASKDRDELRQQLAEREKYVKFLRDAIHDGCLCIAQYGEQPPDCLLEALAATEPITNTRRRNADDMGNPPANAAELLNARKPKP